MTQTLSGRIALVTGASRGVGYGIALELARQGATVIAMARSQDALKPLREEVSALGGQIVPHDCDLADPDTIAPLAGLIGAKWGRLDILVANAAIMGPRSLLDEVSEQEFAEVFATNVAANWRMIRHFGPLMQKSDAPRAVFMTSGSGSKLAPGRGVYAISKSALDAVARTWAAEAEGAALRVMLCNPGPTRTDMRASIKPNEDPMSLKTPADHAPKIAAMCAPDWTHNGKFYDCPRDALLSFRGPA